MRRQHEPELPEELPIVKKRRIDSEPKKPKEVSVCITDPVKPNRLSSLKAIQQVLLWIYDEEHTNPMWINIKNKREVTHCLTFFLETEGTGLGKMVESGAMPTLNEYWGGKTRVEHRYEYMNISEEDPWERLFSTNPLPRKIPKPDIYGTGSLQGDIYATYKLYVLSQDELKLNLYPVEGPLTEDFFDTKWRHNQKEVDDMNDKILAMDCEMVYTSQGLELAKITVVNFRMVKIYQSYVKPPNPVENYNTRFSGITEQILEGVTTTLEDVRQQLTHIFDSDTILIGHSLENDLRAIRFIHNSVIDTSVLFMNEQGMKVSLKSLARTYFKKNIQVESHDSYEDALITLALAKLKIQILDKISKEEPTKFDILEHLLKADTQEPAILSSLHNKFSLIRRYPIEMIPLQKHSAVSSSNQLRWFFKRHNPAKLIFDCIRRSGTETWQDYYLFLDKMVLDLKEILPKNCLLLLNFQLQTHSKISHGIKPFTLFIST